MSETTVNETEPGTESVSELFSLVDDSATETKSPKAKKPAAPKVEKVGKPKAVKKPAAKAPKGKTASKNKKDEDTLRKMQLRALKALVLGKADHEGGALTMARLAKAARISEVVMKRGVGPVDPACREAHDKREGFRSLVTRGMVKCVTEGGVSGFYVTPFGVRAFEKNEDAIKALGKTNKNGQEK